MEYMQLVSIKTRHIYLFSFNENHATYDLSKEMNRTSCGCQRYLDVCTIRNKNLLIKYNQNYLKINETRYRVLYFKVTLPYEVSYNNTFNTELIIIFIKYTI